MEFTTLNGVSGTVQLERVRWRLEEGRLYRDVWPVIDSPADVKPDEVPIVSEVKAMQWRFYHRAGKSWGDSAHLPDGVELTLTMENGDTGAGCLPRRERYQKRWHRRQKTRLPRKMRLRRT